MISVLRQSAIFSGVKRVRNQKDLSCYVDGKSTSQNAKKQHNAAFLLKRIKEVYSFQNVLLLLSQKDRAFHARLSFTVIIACLIKLD